MDLNGVCVRLSECVRGVCMLLHRQERFDLHVYTAWKNIQSMMSGVRSNPHNLVVGHSPWQLFVVKLF